MLNILVVEDEGPIRDWIRYTIKIFQMISI